MNSEELPIAAAAASTVDGVERLETRRRICNKGCDRPVNVCLCDVIPKEPIATGGQVVILHHPHERRHKLATVPVLGKCLKNCEIIVGRRLRLGDSSLLDSLYNAEAHHDQIPKQTLPAVFLFPGLDTVPSIEINEWKSSLNDLCVKNYVLIAFDGTWKHAKEMVHASLPFLSKFATLVCLNYDIGAEGGSIFDSDLLLRKEPYSGCMSTMEAIARCLRVLEPNGMEIESRVVEVLRAMVRFQAGFLKPLKPRMRLLKKGKKYEEKKSERTEVAARAAP